jgi:hypothetical protein
MPFASPLSERPGYARETFILARCSGAEPLFGQKPAQLGLEHLAVIVFGERTDKAIVARALEAGDVVEAQPVERIGGDLGSGSRDDKGDDLLAPSTSSRTSVILLLGSSA